MVRPGHNETDALWLLLLQNILLEDCWLTLETQPGSAPQRPTSNTTPKSTSDPSKYFIKISQPPKMSDFGPVLGQINVSGIASLASMVRQRNEYSVAPPGLGAPFRACHVINSENSNRGSFNLVCFIEFDDGVHWVLKVPAHGHQGMWDDLASNAIISEALTMRLIQQKSTVPVPTVHHFDSSMNNIIHVPHIMMSFMHGRLLDEVWWDDSHSMAKQQQVRFRILQTLARAMAELSKFTFSQGGALQFDSNGDVINIGGARVPDCHAMYNFNGAGEDIYRAKGPTNNPVSDILFMLRKRAITNKDSALERGRLKVLRMFSEWIMEDRIFDEEEFVLAHPDLDTQNILVQDDDTICGVLDWDGVAAVPHERGALKYPLFISRDWDPKNYNYDPATERQRWPNGRREEGPVAQGVYRSMYAQFMERELANQHGGDEAAKRVTLLTRFSHVVGCLEQAASNPWLTECNLRHCFDQWTCDAETLDTDEVFDEDQDSDNSEDNEEEERKDEAEGGKEEGDRNSELGRFRTIDQFP